MTQLSQKTINAGMALLKKYPTLLKKYEVNTKKRKAAFLGQLATEDGEFKPKRESGYYSTISNARNTFKTPFKGKSDDFVRGYLKNSKKMLSYVYANRMGNGSEASGEGYFFRGGGYIMNTGKNQFKELEKKTGIPFSKNPDLITEEVNAIIAALEYWKSMNLNQLSDNWNIDNISDRVNIGSDTKKIGDSNHYDKRLGYSNAFLKLM